MIYFKLLILFQLCNKIHCITNYCEICPEHVLCLYTASGPGEKCRGYDKIAKLTRYEIETIVSKINERRSFVAQGMTKNMALPQAANMRTVSWSDELAVFAQRWADQCDPVVHRDQSDKCRNLAITAVGQNIASVSGSTPGLTVKSFVDMWFMQSLDYAGSVSYYNSSLGGNTDYFTQLIWADTNTVGCGKVKFYIAGGKVPVARLVCNFAPSGNIYGRPVYTIGFPATQCPTGTTPDTTFPGLCCSNPFRNARLPATLSISHSTPVSSLLKIFNLFNDSVTQEIDPIRIDIKQQRAKANETDDRRNQKARHIYNRTNSADTQFKVPMMGNLWNPNINMSRRHDHQTHFDRGHSRIFHGYDYPMDVSTLLPPTDNYRRHYQQQCTRRGGACNECTTSSCITNECATACATNDCQPNRCTRGQTSPCCEQPNPCIQSACNTHDSCAPHCHTTFPTTRCNYDITCECIPKNTCQQSTACPNHFRRQNDNSNAPVSYKDFQYYDLFPNVALRHADKSENVSLKDDIWLVNNKGFTPKSILRGRRVKNRKKTTDVFLNPEKSPGDGEYFYDTLYPNPRKKRKAEEDASFKPFWQMEEYKSKPELKALRYTTLSGMKYFQYSEPVIEGDNYDSTTESDYERPVKEKFLSFDELMNLRINNANKQLSGRRADKATTKKKSDPKKETKKPPPKKPTTKKPTPKKPTTKKPATKKPTTKKPAVTTTKPTTTTTPTTTETFPRIRHCTRQLTCTWTAPTVIGEGGEPRPAGDNGGRGSRTPPGYVEGCTRTSTCTRDYMQRNKLAPSGDVEGSGTEPPAEDEDYCERRSLNVKRRDCGDSPVAVNVFESVVDGPTSTLPYSTTTTYAYSTAEGPNRSHDESCVCDVKNKKMKRSVGHISRFRYRPLCYKMLSEIIEMWRDRLSSPQHNCLCNKAVIVFPYTNLLLVIIIMNLMENTFTTPFIF